MDALTERMNELLRSYQNSSGWPAFESSDNGILEQLNAITHDYAEDFENQRRDYGGAHRIRNEIVSASKRGIAALKSRNMSGVAQAVNDLINGWNDMGRLKIPRDQSWQFEAEAGQELVEFFLVAVFFSTVFFDNDTVPFVPTDRELDVEPQAWLAGLGDAVGEVSKVLREYLLNTQLNREERKDIRRRFLKFAKQVYNYLLQFETAYPMVVNNSRRRFYGQTFRGLIGRVERVIEIHEEAIIRMLDEESRAPVVVPAVPVTAELA